MRLRRSRSEGFTPLSLLPAAWYKADAGVLTKGAAQFDAASSRYLSKSSPTFSPTTKMTIRFSWKPGSVGAYQGLVSRWTVANNQNQFIIDQDANGTILIFIASAMGDTGSNFLNGSTVLVAGTMYEIVVVYDGTLSASNRVAVYVNGVAETLTITGTIPATLTTSTADLCVGSYAAGGGYYANGSIQCLGFSALALSGAALTAAHTPTFYASMTAARQADWFSFFNLCEASSTRVDSTGLNSLTSVNSVGSALGATEGPAQNNSPVSTWQDQSGNARHLTQATLASMPLYLTNIQNGKPGVVFDGVDDYLDVPSISYGVFSQYLATKWTAAGIVVEHGVAGEEYLYRSGAASLVKRGGLLSGYNANVGAAWMDGTYVITKSYNGTHATHLLRRNGAAVAVTSVGGGDDPGVAALAAVGTIGGRAAASLPSAGHLLEYVLQAAAPSVADRDNMETYLNSADRWAVY